MLVGDFVVARAIGGMHRTDSGTPAKRQVDGRVFRCDFVVWQMLQFTMCAQEQQVSLTGGGTGRFG